MSLPSVLITGATGFVGGAIARLCQAEGFPVRTTGRSIPHAGSLANFTRANLSDGSLTRELVAGVDTIIHAAGLAHQFGKSRHNKDQFFTHNVLATDNLIRNAAAHGVRNFILISSVSVYGSQRAMLCKEEHRCCPQDPYGQSKYEAEQRALASALKHGLGLTILRLATVYGEEDPGNVARLMHAIDRGRFAWIGTGDNLKSLIHRDDVARACVVVLSQNLPGVNIFNLSGPPCPMREVVESLAAALGRKLPRWHIPAPLALALARIAGAVGPGISFLQRPYAAIRKWLADDAYDSSRFNQTFSFRTEIPIGEGLRREVSWYRSGIQKVKG
jgi:nucleoside-diphosphate-sugar epimerase